MIVPLCVKGGPVLIGSLVQESTQRLYIDPLVLCAMHIAFAVLDLEDQQLTLDLEASVTGDTVYGRMDYLVGFEKVSPRALCSAASSASFYTLRCHPSAVAPESALDTAALIASCCTVASSAAAQRTYPSELPQQ